jgi:hypothetical protein
VAGRRRRQSWHPRGDARDRRSAPRSSWGGRVSVTTPRPDRSALLCAWLTSTTGAAGRLRWTLGKEFPNRRPLREPGGATTPPADSNHWPSAPASRPLMQTVRGRSAMLPCWRSQGGKCQRRRLSPIGHPLLGDIAIGRHRESATRGSVMTSRPSWHPSRRRGLFADKAIFSGTRS